jgi:hypothetical protein
MERGVWDEETASKEFDKAVEIFVKITDSQAAASSENDPVTRFFNGLSELLAMGKIYFADMDDGKPEDIPATAEKVGWGPDEDGMVYLSLSSALEKVKSLFRGTDEPLMVTTNSLLDLMEQRGIIERSSEEKPRRIVQKKIAKQKQRVLPVPQTILGGSDLEE